MNPRHITVLTPDRSLRNYIHAYTFIRIPKCELGNTNFTVFPNGHSRIVLTLGNSSNKNVASRNQAAVNYSITGFYSRPHTFARPSSSLEQLIIQFHPWGIQPLLDFSLSEITDSRADLTDLFKDDLEWLLNTLGDERSPSEFVRVLDAFFLTLYRNAREVDPRAKAMINLLVQTHGASTLAQLSRNIFVGERTIQRLVQNHIGVSFKFYSTLVRTEYVRKLLDQEDLSLTEVALQAGYFDQSHFNHEFNSIYGESPGLYRKRRHELLWAQLESTIRET